MKQGVFTSGEQGQFLESLIATGESRAGLNSLWHVKTSTYDYGSASRIHDLDTSSVCCTSICCWNVDCYTQIHTFDNPFDAGAFVDSIHEYCAITIYYTQMTEVAPC